MKYVTDYRVKSTELNTRREIGPTELDKLLQESADRQITDRDMPYNDIVTKRHKAFILSRMSIEILDHIGDSDAVQCHTWVVEAKAANFPRAFEMYSEGNMFVKAYSNWALVDLDTGKLLRNGDYDMSNYPFDEEPDLSIPTRFRIPKDMELDKVGEFRVGYSMTDINNHMNNTEYLNVLADYIPGIEDLTITSINIRYIHEAPYKADVDVLMTEPTCAEGIDPRADKVIYFKTVVGGDVNVECVFGYREN